jgi:hypothetical protein
MKNQEGKSLLILEAMAKSATYPPLVCIAQALLVRAYVLREQSQKEKVASLSLTRKDALAANIVIKPVHIQSPTTTLREWTSATTAWGTMFL